MWDQGTSGTSCIWDGLVQIQAQKGLEEAVMEIRWEDQCSCTSIDVGWWRGWAGGCTAGQDLLLGLCVLTCVSLGAVCVSGACVCAFGWDQVVGTQQYMGELVLSRGAGPGLKKPQGKEKSQRKVH